MPEWESTNGCSKHCILATPLLTWQGKKLSEVAADDQHEEVTFAWVRHGKKKSLIFLSLLPPANKVKSKKHTSLFLMSDIDAFLCLLPSSRSHILEKAVGSH